MQLFTGGWCFAIIYQHLERCSSSCVFTGRLPAKKIGKKETTQSGSSKGHGCCLEETFTYKTNQKKTTTSSNILFFFRKGLKRTSDTWREREREKGDKQNRQRAKTRAKKAFAKKENAWNFVRFWRNLFSSHLVLARTDLKKKQTNPFLGHLNCCDLNCCDPTHTKCRLHEAQENKIKIFWMCIQQRREADRSTRNINSIFPIF